jgi:hypothetical protein
MPNDQLSEKERVFLSYYLDKNNPDTYLKGAPSAVLAYKCQTYATASSMASIILRKPKITELIEGFFDDLGLSIDNLKGKLHALLSAKEIKIATYEGKITDTMEVEAHEIQRRTLDMALKVKGAYEKHNRQQAVIIQPPDINQQDEAGK